MQTPLVRFGILLGWSVFLACVSTNVQADEFGLEQGEVVLKSAGPLAAGPQGILFVSDPLDASVYAIDTGERKGDPEAAKINVENLDRQLADLLGVAEDQIRIVDLVVNPLTASAYLSVARGRGPDAIPVLVRVAATGEVEPMDLTDVKFARAEIPNPPAADAVSRGQPLRLDSVTDLAFINSQVVVAGLSNEEFSSNLRSIAFPFSESSIGTSVEIFHGAHGRYETQSPVRTLAPIAIGGEPFVVAAYTCTPLVKFPLAELKPGEKIRGTTVAELGNRNRPLDMIVYEKGGEEFILMANSARGVMKISTADLEREEGITDRIEGTAGQPYQTIADLEGVMQLDKLNSHAALILVEDENKHSHLKTIELP